MTTTPHVTVRLGWKFYRDHIDRGLAAGEIVAEQTRTVDVRLDRDAYDELLGDAMHYAHEVDDAPRGLVAAAQRVLDVLLAVDRPDPAAPLPSPTPAELETPAELAAELEAELRGGVAGDTFLELVDYALGELVRLGATLLSTEYHHEHEATLDGWLDGRRLELSLDGTYHHAVGLTVDGERVDYRTDAAGRARRPTQDEALETINEQRRHEAGVETRAVRIAAPADTLEALESLTPRERGRRLELALARESLQLLEARRPETLREEQRRRETLEATPEHRQRIVGELVDAVERAEREHASARATIDETAAYARHRELDERLDGEQPLFFASFPDEHSSEPPLGALDRDDTAGDPTYHAPAGYWTGIDDELRAELEADAELEAEWLDRRGVRVRPMTAGDLEHLD